jgi:hypothetical protein
MTEARKYGTWRKRALAAEQRADALEQMLKEKSGMGSAEWMMVDGLKCYADRPAFNIRITGITA